MTWACKSQAYGCVMPTCCQEDEILLDEIPAATGSVQPNMRFCPSSADRLVELGISTTSLIEAPHPLTAQPGCWVDRDSWDRVESLRVELWPDPLIDVVYHLESHPESPPSWPPFPNEG
jgi:hypothetical protein